MVACRSFDAGMPAGTVLSTTEEQRHIEGAGPPRPRPLSLYGETRFSSRRSTVTASARVAELAARKLLSG